MDLFHYTDEAGYKSIGSQTTWLFKASQPPGDHPFGAYFTDLDEYTPLLAKKLRIPRTKMEYFFCFRDTGDLNRLKGGRGKHILYSTRDYCVLPGRQVRCGRVPTDEKGNSE